MGRFADLAAKYGLTETAELSSASSVGLPPMVTPPRAPLLELPAPADAAAADWEQVCAVVDLVHDRPAGWSIGSEIGDFTLACAERLDFPLIPGEDLAAFAARFDAGARAVPPVMQPSARSVSSQLVERPTLPAPPWDAETARRIAWLRTAQLPLDQPFQLMDGVKITNPVRYFEDLRNEIAAGPTGPRARYGALQADLRRIEAWAADGYPTTTVTPREWRGIAPGEVARSIRLHIARGLPVYDVDGNVHYTPVVPERGGDASPAAILAALKGDR